MSADTCTAEDCFRRARRNGLCWTHYTQQRKATPKREVRAYRRFPRQAVEDAMFTFLDLRPTDDEGWRKARATLWKTIERYAEQWARKKIKKWERIRPPLDKTHRR